MVDSEASLQDSSSSSRVKLMLLALYVGPELWMPLASVLGAIAGVVMIFWRYLVALARRTYQVIARRE